ncbi:MAG TPA: biotin/lipoyl-binding protein, partial [Blastocatellia bacterium]|nr:biotin/lipoyl-binding protein [Blastocatellia bacterium]
MKDTSATKRNLLIGAAAIALAAVTGVVFWPSKKAADTDAARAETAKEKAEQDESDVALPAEALASSNIEIVGVTERSAPALLKVASEVEPNATRLQIVSSLTQGHVANVLVTAGQRVSAGAVLATIQSPQIAELRGLLLEARSKLTLASANVERVRKSANRAGVISAKAKLEVAERTLGRQKRLFEIGAASLKEVEAAEAEYKTANAQYDYESNIVITREIEEAESVRELARVTVERLRGSLVAFGGDPDRLKADQFVSVHAPISGSVIKREVNPGSGVQEGTPLFTIA